jgi:uncharacterized protein (DUF488 family)
MKDRTRFPISTIGHSTRPIEEFIRLLQENGIEFLADVRAFPGSRHNSRVARLDRNGVAAAYRHHVR